MAGTSSRRRPASASSRSSSPAPERRSAPASASSRWARPTSRPGPAFRRSGRHGGSATWQAPSWSPRRSCCGPERGDRRARRRPQPGNSGLSSCSRSPSARSRSVRCRCPRTAATRWPSWPSCPCCGPRCAAAAGKRRRSPSSSPASPSGARRWGPAPSFSRA